MPFNRFDVIAYRPIVKHKTVFNRRSEMDSKRVYYNASIERM